MELAQKYPETNFIGIERYSGVLLRALQKREELEISNIYFMCVDAKRAGRDLCAGRGGEDLLKLFLIRGQKTAMQSAA